MCFTFSSSKIEEFINSEAEELSIDRCNAFIRRLVHQESRRRWPKKVNLDFKSDGLGQTILVTKTGTKEEEEKKEVERREKENQELEEAVGLSVLLRKIANSVCIFLSILFLYMPKNLCNINVSN